MKLICNECGKEVRNCSNCSELLKPDDTVHCCNGEHFCSENCLLEWFVPDECYEVGVTDEEEIKEAKK